MSDTLDYGNMMHDAMRGLISDVLKRVQADGLPGQHHFFINFDTQHEDVEIAPWMHEQFEEDMTIVLQHWFADLAVDDNGFRVTCNFADVPETLYVPFDAINTFVDPSVEFGLRFEIQSEDEAPDLHIAGEDDAALDDEVEEAPFVDTDEAADADEPKEAEVVSLDSFRK